MTITRGRESSSRIMSISSTSKLLASVLTVRGEEDLVSWGLHNCVGHFEAGALHATKEGTVDGIYVCMHVCVHTCVEGQEYKS